MKWSLPGAGALVISAVLIACSGDEGAPGPGGTSTSSTSSSGADAGGTGKKPNATVGCNDGSECESNVCFPGNAQHFCTLSCTTENAPTVCVAPLTGTCNKQGFCKRD